MKRLIEDHRVISIGALPHLDLGQDQRRLPGMIDANESIRSKFASRIVRRLHWLGERPHRNMESKQKSSRQTRGQKSSARHSFEAFLRKCHTTLLRLTS